MGNAHSFNTAKDIDGANWNATTKKPPPTHTLTLEITQEGYDMLTKSTVEAGQESQQTKCVLKKENEKMQEELVLICQVVLIKQ